MAEKTKFAAPTADALPAECCGTCTHGHVTVLKSGPVPAGQPQPIECRWGPGTVIVIPQQMTETGTFILQKTTESPVRPAGFRCGQFLSQTRETP